MRDTLSSSLVVNGQKDMVWCLKEYTKSKYVLSLLIVLG